MKQPLPIPTDVDWTSDPGQLSRAATDFGGFVSHLPAAVAFPRDTAEMAKVVRFARSRNAPWNVRGQAHSVAGQSQLPHGLIVETSRLNDIAISGQHATVGGGVLWSQLLTAALPHGLAPPVLTDYLELSVGGTLSVGGIGGATHRHGFQTDNVTSLEVVTPNGEIKRCSPRDDRALFDAVRAGRGRAGVITSATVRLVSAPARVRHYQLYYDNLETFLADQCQVMRSERFDYLEGQVVTAESGRWRFMLEAAVSGDDPSDDAIAGLRHIAGDTIREDKSFLDFANRLAEPVALLRELGEWGKPHPWCNVFVPARHIATALSRILPELSIADIGKYGSILVYPFDSTICETPGLRMASDDTVFLLALLRCAVDSQPRTVERLLAANDQIALLTAELGGTVYLEWRHSH